MLELARLEQAEKEKVREREEKDRERVHALELSRLVADQAIRLAEITRQQEKERGEAQATQALAQGELGESSGRVGQNLTPHRNVPTVNMSVFTDQPDQLEDFCLQFERLAEDLGIDRGRWGVQLTAVMSHRGQQCINALPVEDRVDYDTVKAALMTHYHVTAERYKRQFKEATKKPHETHAQFHFRVGVLFNKWVGLEGCGESFDRLRELMIREQIMATYRKELKVFIAERETESLEAIAKVADRYEQAHRDDRTSRPAPRNLDTTPKPQVGESEEQTSKGNAPQDQNKPKPSAQEAKKGWVLGGARGVQCHWCSEVGHIKRDCPKRKIAACVHARRSPSEKAKNVTHIRVNGQEVECLLDTGASLPALVDSSLVNQSDLLDENIWVQYANSSSQSLPLAEIIVDSPYVSGKIVAAVSEKALYPVTLGLEYVRPVPKGMCDSGARQSDNSSNSEEKAVSPCQEEETKEDYMANSLLGRCFEASCVRPYA